MAEQANKALFSLLKKSRSLTLPFDIQIDLFNKMIKPILLYGCEIWGTGNIDILERVQLKFFKLIFNLKNTTPSYMIYGELGIRPLYVNIQKRIISFWCKLIEIMRHLDYLQLFIMQYMYFIKKTKLNVSGSIT